MLSHSLLASYLALLLLLPFHLSYVLAELTSPERILRRDYDAVEKKLDPKKHDQEFFSFVTRPDIDAPRWDVKVYDKYSVSPGYWLMAPYSVVAQSGHKRAWVAPHIFDGNGELIWSGAPTFNNYDAFDFKVSNVLGTDMLTTIIPHEGIAAILDSSYDMQHRIDMGDERAKIGERKLNLHDFQMVDNGKRALFLTKSNKHASLNTSKVIGYDGSCNVTFTGFEEWDMEAGESMFEWSSEDHIGLDESTVTQNPVQKRCTGDSWDYLHGNAISKLPDGDYLLSGRRSDALYKISHQDGSIVWRLNGKKSDFTMAKDVHFSGQHDARCIMQNETHMMVSFLDNAVGPGVPHKTNDYSRGLVLLLHTSAKPMTATMVAHYDHPHQKYAPARGSYQTLPSGNVFMGWTDDSLISEHAPDGRLIMEAKTKAGLKSYRNYKHPWVGRPKQPPDVHSAAVLVKKIDEIMTIVHVSWNGATEVASWDLYKSNADGDPDSAELVASVPRQGFESSLTYKGYASHVVVHALDHAGKTLGVSRVVLTIPPPDLLSPAVIQEAEWLQEHSGTGPSWQDEVASVFAIPAVIFACGILFCMSALLTVWVAWNARRKGMMFWKRKTPSYQPLYNDEKEEGDDVEDGRQYDKTDGVVVEQKQGRASSSTSSSEHHSP